MSIYTDECPTSFYVLMNVLSFCIKTNVLFLYILMNVLSVYTNVCPVCLYILMSFLSVLQEKTQRLHELDARLQELSVLVRSLREDKVGSALNEDD